MDNISKDWNERYTEIQGHDAPGTFIHSDKGNRYFYKTKFCGIDRCMKKIGFDFRNKNILDVAGGSGEYIRYFLKRGAQHITIADFSCKALEIVNLQYGKRQSVSTLICDITEKNFKWPDEYDLVLMLEAIFLLQNDEDFNRAIKNLSSAVTTGGFLILSDIFPFSAFQEHSYVKRRSRGDVERLLKENGLSVMTYYPQTYIFNRRIFGRFQFIVERFFGFLLFFIDQFALRIGCRAKANGPSDMKYLIALKECNGTH